MHVRLIALRLMVRKFCGDGTRYVRLTVSRMCVATHPISVAPFNSVNPPAPMFKFIGFKNVNAVAINSSLQKL